MAKKMTSAAKVSGRWEESRASWYEQTAAYCDACGRLIPRMQFIVEKPSGRRKFCGLDCAQFDARPSRTAKRISS
jgi:hypothetical protein